MGTNFYRILTHAELVEKKKKLIEDCTNLDLSPSSAESGFSYNLEDSWESRNIWTDFIENTNIHLGKRSSGWKFCWNFHKNKYYSTKEELLAFVRSGRIVDEYGHEHDAEEFIEMALSWCQPDGLTHNREYEIVQNKRNPNRLFFGAEYWDLEIDGLRVSSATEFS